MGCSNCFNGCADIISDKCVKYTGNNFTLGEITIETGDSLLMVENDILFLISILHTGTGIIPAVDVGASCASLDALLPNGTNSDLNEILQAISTVLCGAVADIEALQTTVNEMNAPFTVDCLAPLDPSAGVHDVLQAVIDKLCEVEANLEALTLELHTNYVTNSQLPILIQDYLDNSPTTSLVNNKMIPDVAYPFFGDPSGKFDITGAGIGDWIKVYICNGANNTPDLRGRVLVGATVTGPVPFSAIVDPNIPGNPNYTMLGVTAEQGVNNVILGVTHMPNHTHIASVNIIDPGHRHTYTGSSGDSGEIGGICPTLEDQPQCDMPGKLVDSALTGLKGNVNDSVNPNVIVTNSNEGGGNGHPNYQPGRATLYIMYKP